ncbi:hypothetical protein HU200_013914 [Digitaria exilis]|uniref:SBP-type domain-containing protein n=1 Tax=Digitaria exilis TaxID=1010633 RepID=A0A835KJ88_9POAL|nr:hypothetical protein HU200_013914 [Digitaria exilis]
MDWDLKAPGAWDLADLEHDGDHAGAAAAAEGHSGGNAAANAAAKVAYRPPGAPECSVDLKLGGLGEESASAAVAGKAPVAAAAAVAPGPGAPATKRARPASGGTGQQQQQCPSCAVEGCTADLSKCRDYHRRHKVCEAHSKTPVVVLTLPSSIQLAVHNQADKMAGSICYRPPSSPSAPGAHHRCPLPCSSMGPWEEDRKRSIAWLSDAPMRVNAAGKVGSCSPIVCQDHTHTTVTCRVSRLSDSLPAGRTPSMIACSPSSFGRWNGRVDVSPCAFPSVIKTEENPYYTHQIPLGTNSSRQHFVGSSSAYAKDGRRFPFLQEGEISFATGVVLEAPAASARQPPPVLKTSSSAPPESSGGGGKAMFADGLTRVLDSDCALSLLSAPANSSGIDVVSRMVRPTEHVPMAQPVVSGLQFGSTPWFSRPHASPGGAAAAAASTAGFPSCAAVEGEQQQLNTVLGSNDNELSYGGMFHGGGGGGGEGSSGDGTTSSMPFSWPVVVPAEFCADCTIDRAGDYRRRRRHQIGKARAARRVRARSHGVMGLMVMGRTVGLVGR